MISKLESSPAESCMTKIKKMVSSEKKNSISDSFDYEASISKLESSPAEFCKRKIKKMVSSEKSKNSISDSFDDEASMSKLESSPAEFRKRKMKRMESSKKSRNSISDSSEDEASLSSKKSPTSSVVGGSELIRIPIAVKNEHGGRVYDKRQCCYFCGKIIVSKVGRHLKTHKKECSAFVADQPSEIIALNLLRTRGNFYHNINVLKLKEGKLIVVRRPNKEISYKKYVPCKNCLGFFLKDELWRHTSGCNVEGETEKSLVISCKLLLYSSVNENHSNILTQVVHNERGGMRNDAVTLVAKNDTLILTYGSFVLSQLHQ